MKFKHRFGLAMGLAVINVRLALTNPLDIYPWGFLLAMIMFVGLALLVWTDVKD